MYVDSIHMDKDFRDCVGFCRHTVTYTGVRQYVHNWRACGERFVGETHTLTLILRHKNRV
jgi:hypothetical protein